MIYWTKPEMEYNEELDIYTETGKLEIIKEFEGDYVPDGCGFEVDMNGIKYKIYLKNPENYEIVDGVLNKIK